MLFLPANSEIFQKFLNFFLTFVQRPLNAWLFDRGDFLIDLLKTTPSRPSLPSGLFAIRSPDWTKLSNHPYLTRATLGQRISPRLLYKTVWQPQLCEKDSLAAKTHSSHSHRYSLRHFESKRELKLTKLPCL